MSNHPTSEARVPEYITETIPVTELAEGQQLDCRGNGRYARRIRVDFDTNRISFQIEDLDGAVWGNAEIPFDGVVTLTLGRKRVAEIVGGARDSKQVAAYLPGNYRVVPGRSADQAILIEGYDRAGWTLEGYVIPRLASGLIFATEVN